MSEKIDFLRAEEDQKEEFSIVKVLRYHWTFQSFRVALEINCPQTHREQADSPVAGGWRDRAKRKKRLMGMFNRVVIGAG